MKRTALPMLSLLLLGVFAHPAHATGASSTFRVVPFEFDPGKTDLVAAKWKTGLGCPSNGGIVPDFAPSTPPFADPGCPTTDTRDTENEGLLLAKSGPSATNASAGATILGVSGITLTDVGYDLRKPDTFIDPRGSHCGAGSPRFNVVTTDGVTHFIGCNSPAPLQTTVGAWIRLRWAPSAALPPITSKVKSIQILMDEGTDTGPDNFGVAILDNIDINGTLIGRGPSRADEGDKDHGHGGDRDHHFNFHHSSSRPETSEFSYQDDPGHAKVQSVSGARSIAYSGAAVTFVQDALFNGEPGYVVTFTATDLSALSTPLLPQIGSYTVVVTGAQGIVYQITRVVSAGLIQIHPH